MKKKRSIILVILVALAVFAAAGVILFKKFAPGLTQRSMSEQYKMGKDETLIIVDGEMLEQKGKLVSSSVYVPLEIATNTMNKRIYWDDNESILSLVTTGGLITVNMADSLHFSIGKQNNESPYQILYQDGDTTYVAMEFVAQYSRINYSYKENPNRIIVQADFNEAHSVAVLKDDIRLRVGPNKKYDYLLQLEKGQEILVDTKVKKENGYQKICTMDGIEGYVPEEYVTEVQEKCWTTDKMEDVFSQLKQDGTICLGWHQMSEPDDGTQMQSKTAQTKSLNVISPTWFALSDNKGNVSSIASSQYVSAAHAKGLKVWGLVNDFGENNKKLKLKKVLGRTSTRTKLINKLVTLAMQYDLDGINVDFEKVTSESAKDYLEFLRELVLVCHANDIVVSVDDYVPTASSAHYDWEEQGKVVDYVIFMAYDEHYSGSPESGSVSSLPFVKNGLETGLEYVPAERIIMAFPFYTRLWKEDSDGKLSGRPTVYGMSSAESLLQSKGASVEWEEVAGQYYGEYKEHGYKYRIWLEEETSLEKKMELAFSQQVAGIAFWKLGFERPVTWTTIGKCISKEE